jgi:hypothetical protein
LSVPVKQALAMSVTLLPAQTVEFVGVIVGLVGFVFTTTVVAKLESLAQLESTQITR